MIVVNSSKKCLIYLKEDNTTVSWLSKCGLDYTVCNMTIVFNFPLILYIKEFTDLTSIYGNRVVYVFQVPGNIFWLFLWWH